MNNSRSAGVAVLVIGVAVLIWGGFSYTKDSSKAKIGSLELVVKDTRRINIPLWAGVLAVALGGGLLLMPQRSS
jgi:TRAP-type C4-dicarboxylate transport system permease small subunit